MNLELADVQAGFRKGTGIRDQIANIHWITEKTRARGSAGEYQADERAGVAGLSWRVSGRWTGRCHAAQLASIRQMSGQVSRGSAGEYQADEWAGIARTSWRLSVRGVGRFQWAWRFVKFWMGSSSIILSDSENWDTKSLGSEFPFISSNFQIQPPIKWHHLNSKYLLISKSPLWLKKLCSKIISVFFKKERAMNNLGKLLAGKNGEMQTKK